MIKDIILLIIPTSFFLATCIFSIRHYNNLYALLSPLVQILAIFIHCLCKSVNNINILCYFLSLVILLITSHNIILLFKAFALIIYIVIYIKCSKKDTMLLSLPLISFDVIFVFLANMSLISSLSIFALTMIMVSFVGLSIHKKMENQAIYGLLILIAIIIYIEIP